MQRSREMRRREMNGYYFEDKEPKRQKTLKDFEKGGKNDK